MKWLCLTALVLLCRAAQAAPPTGCTANVPESLQASVAGTVVLPVMNKHACILNWLQTRTTNTMADEYVCTPAMGTVVPAAGRRVFTITPAVALQGDEAVSVEVLDTSQPAFPTVEKIGIYLSSEINVTVMNHDAQLGHLAQVCARIGRQ